MSISLLSDLTVVDLTTTPAGATAARLYADLGARVIRIEATGIETPEDDVGLSPEAGLVANRSKESVAIDFASRESSDVLARLLGQADLLVEDLGAEVRAGIGLACGEHRAAHPSLVHVALDWWPESGAGAGLPRSRELLQATVGTMVFDAPGGAPRPVSAVPVGEPTAATFAVMAGLSALLRRDATGVVSCGSTSVYQGAIQPASTGVVYAEDDQEADTTGPVARRALGGFGPFECADGEWVFVAGWTDRQFQAVCRLAGYDHIAEDPAYGSRSLRQETGEDLNAIVAAWVSGLQSNDLIDQLRSARVPVARIAQTTAQLIHDSHAVETGMVTQVGNGADQSWQIGTVFEVAGERPDIRPAPAPGADSIAVLERLGLTSDEVSDLLRRGVISQPERGAR